MSINLGLGRQFILNIHHHGHVNEEAGDKVLEVEQKYNEIRRPVYLKRNEVIKTIPDFWLTAFLSHPALCDLLTEEDQKGASNGVNGEKKGKKRPLTEDSFFSWFGETDQKDITELHDEVAEIIKEDLWPNPLKYFNNDIDEDEEDSDGEDDEENGDEDDDEGEE
uniref:NAP1-related protein 2-like n=1 Tax=Cucumis melo TaxID=3656 RepID=A0A9I9DQL4_CUCME